MRRTATRWRILACFACLVAAGAAAQQGATAAAGTGAAGAARGDAQESGTATSAEEPREEELISLTVTDASIQDVLRSLAAMRPSTNVLMGPEVQGTVSFALRDVTWDMAMKLITESHGFEITEEGNLFRVHKPAPEPEAVEEPDILVELLTEADVEALTDEQIKKLLGPPPLARPRTPEEAREIVLAAPETYLRRLSVDNQPAVAVVTALAKKADLNYAFTPAVTPPPTPAAPQEAAPKKEAEAEEGPPAQLTPQQPPTPSISLSLQFISVEDALQLVAERGQLSCLEESGVWVITPLPPQQVPIEPSKMETLKVKFIRVDDELVDLCKGLLTPRGTVAAGKNNYLVVKDTASGLDAVKEALTVMDEPTPQVLIEARFFELSTDADSTLGIDWKDLGTTGVSLRADPLTGEWSDSLSTTKQREWGGKTGSVTTENESLTDIATGVVTGTAKTVTSIVENVPGVSQNTRTHSETSARTAILDVSQFGIVLHALLSQSDSKQLANPKILVNSEEQATIHIGEQTPIIKSTVETTTGGSPVRTFELDGDFGGEAYEEVELAPEEGTGSSRRGKMRKYTTPKGYLDLGTKLTVRPSVKTEDEVYIKVLPELVSVIAYETVGTAESEVRYPVLFATRVNTEFTIRSGQTIAIGGLVKETTRDSESKVPMLGSIPALGRLFRYDTHEKSQAETIIFLTVKIVPTDEMETATGIPVRSYLVQPEIERIADEDSEGAEYNPERSRSILDELAAEAEEKKWSANKIRQRLREMLRDRGATNDTGPAPLEPIETIPMVPQEAPAPSAGSGG